MSKQASGDPEDSGISPERIEHARAGSPDALGELLESCRPYLLGIANDAFPAELQAKAGASDIVQQTFQEAHEGFAQFRGASGPEFMGWLKRMLLNNLANLNREFLGTAKRDVGREAVPESGESPADPPVISPSPSSAAGAIEEAERLAVALTRLTEDQRLALQLRQQERLTFAQIGARLGRSTEAARKLWARAIERLRQELKPPHETG